jgi:hypothetical protein
MPFCLQTDLEHRRAVSTEEGEQFARENGLYFIETSKSSTREEKITPSKYLMNFCNRRKNCSKR